MSNERPNRRKIVNLQSDWRAFLRFALPFFVMLSGALIIVKTLQYEIADALFSSEGEESVLRLIGETTAAGAAGIIILGMVTAVLWLISARRIFGPSVQFRRHIKNLNNGDYTSRVRLRRGDEFVELADDLNHLAETLAAAQKRDEKGMTLVEVLIAVGIMSVVAIGAASMFDGQQRQLRALTQKQEMIDLRNMMLLQLSKPEVCLFHLQGQRIDVSGVTSETHFSPTVLDLSELRQGPSATSALFAQKGKALPSSLTGLTVSTISFKNIHATGNAHEYHGVFEINFRTDSMVYAMKPIQVSEIVHTTAGDPPSSARIDSCSSTTTFGNNCQIIDEARPWIKKELICSNNSGGKSILTLSFYNPGGEALYAASHGHQPLTVVYLSDTGVFSRSYDGPSGDAYSCIGPNLKDIIKDRNNGCTN